MLHRLSYSLLDACEAGQPERPPGFSGDVRAAPDKGSRRSSRTAVPTRAIPARELANACGTGQVRSAERRRPLARAAQHRRFGSCIGARINATRNASAMRIGLVPRKLSLCARESGDSLPSDCYACFALRDCSAIEVPQTRKIAATCMLPLAGSGRRSFAPAGSASLPGPPDETAVTSQPSGWG
ncbi:hypothetical protein NSU_1475 [Novosphingobium pentaromativorans US6-1]|uniref:Uncharacterized protein n=1 Tax=Novosphingobium pentaromativorans US6-1 TaxID=1088721 RepID=G6EAS7_9SPHN|nr:hypothetical protein NSU_1475 [Novosphingobium pentaromativorans US6-1]